LSGSNKADSTEVCTETAPAVVQEHVSRNETVEQIEAIDRERHIHHHQHRVQPIVDQQTLPTQHQYNVVPEVSSSRIGKQMWFVDSVLMLPWLCVHR
jgi:(2Fe-2S) ferredoxin